MTAILLIAAAAAPAAAEASAPETPPPAAAAEAARGVIAYPPSYFAEARPQTAFDMIQRLPGFSFDGGQQVRGLAGSGGNVLIDGEPPVSKNDNLDEALRRIPAASVARIDLIRGGAPGIDMQGKSVVANVIRKSGSGFRGALQGTLIPVYDGRVNAGLRAEGQWRWDGKLAEGSVLLGRGADDWLGEGPRVRVGPKGETLIRSHVDADAEGLRLWMTGAYERPLAGGRLRINAGHFWEPYNGEYTDVLATPPGREYQYQTMDRERSELGARWTRDLTARLNLEAVGFQQWNYRYLTDRLDAGALTRDFTLDRASSETVGKLHLRFKASDRLSLETGGEAAFNVLNSTSRFIQNAVRIPLPNASLHAEETRGEVFALATWRPSDRLTVEGAVRQEISTITATGDASLEKTLTFTKPRLAFTWAPDPANQLRLRLEREVGQLNFNDFVGSSSVVNTGAVVVGNPDISPQQAWVLEAAYERRFWTGGAVVLTLRHSELTDVVDRVPIFGVGGVVADAPGNIGEGTRDDLIVNLTLPLDRLGVRGGLFKATSAWRRTEVTDPVTLSPRPVSWLWPQDWEAHFSQDLPRWNATWGIDVRGPTRETYYRLSEIEHLKFGHWIVVFAEYKPRPDLLLRVEVVNAGERDFRQIREVYAGPRGRNPILYTNARSLEFGRMIQIRLRKTFGG